MSGPTDRHHRHDTWSAWYPDPQSPTPMWVRDCLVPECSWRQGSSHDPAVAGVPPDGVPYDRLYEYVMPIIAKAGELVADATPELADEMAEKVKEMGELLAALDFHNRHAKRGT